MSDKGLKFESENYDYSDPILKIFRVHPGGVRIVKANKDLLGRANISANVFCASYRDANSYGWWIFPGKKFDLDVTCHEMPVDGCFTGRWGGNFTAHINGYDNSDFVAMNEFESKISNKHNLKYSGKVHVALDEPERNCISIWTGCFFQLPKDWSLMIKSPTNSGLIYDQGSPACIQEGILEVDWMRYDIWMNFKFHTYDKKLSFRHDQDWPIAQLIPIHRSCYENNWQTEEHLMSADDPDCVGAYERYSEYNWMKWVRCGEKDGMTARKLKKSESVKYPRDF